MNPDFIAGPPQALQRIHPLRERVSGMQGSVQGCIRGFMLQKEAGCARLLPQRVRSSGLLSDTQGNGHGEACAESIHHMGDTLRLIMDLAGLQDESVHAESHGPLRRLDNLSLVKTVTFQGRIRRTQAAVSAVPFATVREFDQASDKDMLSLFPGPHLVGVSKSSFRISFRCIPFLLPSIHRSTPVPAGKAIGKASGAWVTCRFWRRISSLW